MVSKILHSGCEVAFTVIDERSDYFAGMGQARLYKISKEKWGFGFYLWQDDDGHFVQEVTCDSPADKAGKPFLIPAIWCINHVQSRMI